MFAPDYVHWEGVFEVAHRFYIEMVPEIREAIEQARQNGNQQGADKVAKLLDETLASPMHRWFKGAKPPKAWRPSDDDNHGFNIMKERMKAEAAAAREEKD